MTDLMLYLFLGFCALFAVIWIVTGAEWCQRLMVKKYFPQTVEILKHYQENYKFWQMAINDIDKIDDKIKWHSERLEYYLVVNNQEVIQELNQLHIKRKQIVELEKKLKEMLKQDKYLIEAQAPFILFSEFHPFKILDRQEFNIFDIVWVHRKQKKFEKIVKKHLTYLEDCDII
jgi:DNA repair ATPase RecN